MDKILLFAGTTEGRQLAEYLDRHQVTTHVCVATEYGESLLVEGTYLKVHAGRLTEEEMIDLMEQEQITLTIDATHPYAALVSENIRLACEQAQVEYLRLIREPLGTTPDCVCVDSVQEAVEFLKNTQGNILVTTGSKELHKFTELPDYQERVYARVLSTPEVAFSCGTMGFVGSHLICMQGPFGEELNTAMLRHVQASWMVTKESGKSGGYEEKIRAAHKAGAGIVLVGRPVEAVPGLNEMEVRHELCKRLNLPVHPQIRLVGIGMGTPENMTLEAKEAIQEAELLIGASRMLDVVDHAGKACFSAYQAEEIRDYVKEHPEYEKIAILLSGDIGFYSGAKKLFSVFDGEDIQAYSGISSLVYLCGKLHTSWEDVKALSLHGRSQNIIAAIRTNRKVFALIGNTNGVHELCEKLLSYQMGHVEISVGEKLSYKGERITTGTPRELMEQEFSPLCVVLVTNDQAEKRKVHGIPDEAFLRDKVPMTKEEVRSVSLSKLGLTEDAICYDIGAGTGSVSVEMAIQAPEGQVYAVEKKKEAVALLLKNKEHFAVDNLEIIEGLAPEAMEALPAPTHVFVGGSSGNLKAILENVFEKNQKARVVINAITLETVAEAMECIRELPVEDVDIVTIQTGKAKEAGAYHLMMGQNPVYVFSFTGGAQR